MNTTEGCYPKQSEVGYVGRNILTEITHMDNEPTSQDHLTKVWKVFTLCC